MASSVRSALFPRLTQLCSSRSSNITSIARPFSSSCLRLQSGLIPYSSEQQKVVAKLNSSESTSSTQGDMININAPEHLYAGLGRLRVIPKDKAFYMANPPHEENMRKLNDLLRTHINLPTVTREESTPVSWSTFGEYSAVGGGTRLKPIQYKSLIKVLNRLSLIDSQLMPSQVWEAIAPFIKDRASKSSSILTKTLDEFGRAVAVGRRKASSARIYMTNNTEEIKGQILVNGKPINEYFPRLAQRAEMLYPLTVVEAVGDYNIFATVSGGGTTGQSGAVALAIARALVIHNPLLKPRLHKAGCLTRDSRTVERKKPGKPKARKSYTWVKR